MHNEFFLVETSLTVPPSGSDIEAVPLQEGPAAETKLKRLRSIANTEPTAAGRALGVR